MQTTKPGSVEAEVQTLILSKSPEAYAMMVLMLGKRKVL
jgi:hypothetical protein